MSICSKPGGVVPRPEKLRRIGQGAPGRGFKPIGRPVSELEVEGLRLDELEALRLADLEGLYQEAAAQRMGISRATFARILGRARTAVARALIEERVLVIGEGPVIPGSADPLPCPIHDGAGRRGHGCRCRHGAGHGEAGRGRGARDFDMEETTR
jgi:predicted DNA-binding protein (UPF0251 family)